MDPRIDDPYPPGRERTPEDDLIESVADEDVEHAYSADVDLLSEARLRLLKLAVAWRREEDLILADVGDEEFLDVFGVARSELDPGRARSLALALRGRPPSPPVRPPGVPLDAVYGGDGTWWLEGHAFDATGRPIDEPPAEPPRRA
jgi:hypothetical protein